MTTRQDQQVSADLIDGNGPLSLLKGAPLAFPENYPHTLGDALHLAAQTDKGMVFIDDRGGETPLTYSRLLEQATRALGGLQKIGAAPGSMVILQLDELDEFLVSFWACVLGGLVPVPVLPFRNAGTEDSSFRKLQKIAAQLDKPIILMSSRNAKAVRELAEIRDSGTELFLPGCCIVTFSEFGINATPGKLHTARQDDLAFLQFTSGSTSHPKGTRITHKNVLATIHSMIVSMDVTASSSLLNWMPYYHDLGLIGGHLMAVVSRCKVVAMKPFSFVRRPLLWLTKIHEHRITITFSPNFGLKRILEKACPEQLAPLDLGCLDVILNGAEPISIKTTQRFLDLLHEHCGLHRECLMAGYGLAEASLAVTGAPRGQLLEKHVLNRDALGCGDRVKPIAASDPKATRFADVGPVVTGMELRIVGADDQVVPVSTVGHVQIRGDSVTRGYFANDEANRTSFCGDWFRTGDLGFIHAGRFVITGRVKDVVFINGQNYYSHDFEHACEHIDGLDRLVVIGHYDDETNEDVIVVFVACNRQYTGAREKIGILRKVQMRINQCFDVTPTVFVLLKSTGEIPKTSSGKIIRHKLLKNYLEGHFANQCIDLVELLEIAPDLDSDPDSGIQMTIAELKLLIRYWWSEVLGISEKAIGDHDPFFTLGGTSIKAMEVLAMAEEQIDRAITHDMFREFDTIHRLANYLARQDIGVRYRLDNLVKLVPSGQGLQEDLPGPAERLDEAANESPWSDDTGVREDDIAIIGMGCIFPQANDISEFWQLLMEGRDCVTEVPNDRYNINHYYEKDGTAFNRTISKWGSFIENHYFDPGFFNLTESEAINMDPHQRVFLSAAWQAIQDSGLVNFEGSRMGVFVGASGTGFYQQHENAHLTPATLTGALANLAAARVSNAFNLKGPSLSVDTACSSSLVSVDLACKSILSGESDTAIAGGVQIMESVLVYLMFSRAGILSPDGKCYTFSDKANGFVPGEGAGAVVLKRYRQAIEDGDRVYAVIKASAMNNDGASLGIMSPNPGGQEAVIKAALKQADIDPADIGYVEAHGTGTHIGDLIEVRSLSLAFNENQPVANQSCAIGSVKTNLGHQLAAAGVSGLMKAALAVYHREIPATLNCGEARKELKLEDTPFFICKEPTPWPGGDKQRLAAVNSFGFGGTNAHVILGSACHEDVYHHLPALPDVPYVICLSAKSSDSLDASRSAFADYAQHCPSGTGIRDIAYTYGARRAHYRQNRIAMVANSLEAAAQLAQGGKADGATLIETRDMPRMRRRLAWLFSGQGSQYPGMGRHLFRNEPVFRDTVNRCDEISRPLLGESLRALLVESDSPAAVSTTAITQPLVFTMDFALARLWQSWGVKPDFMLGHSIGEYVAACLGGVFAFEDALRTVLRRGALMGALPAGGGMTAVRQTGDELTGQIEALGLPLDIAAVNGPGSTVISGELTALADLHQYLDSRDVVYQPLQVSHAFHSRHMTPVLEEYRQFLADVPMQAPATPLISNTSGKLYQGNESSPDYWVEHIRRPVQFCKGVQNLVAAGAEIFLEVGAQGHLAGQARRIVKGDHTLVLSSLPRQAPAADDARHLAHTQASLYANGLDIDWIRYYVAHGERRWQDRSSPGGVERRNTNCIGVAGGRMNSVPTYALERRSMFRVVGGQSYPFRHLFQRTGEASYKYVPDPEAALFSDHVVARTPMLSGAGQCDLISHLHCLSFAHPPKQLRKLSFHQPWLVNSSLTVAFSGKDEKEFAVTDARGNPVFKGYSSTLTRCEVPPAVSINELEQRLPRSWSQQAVYDLFSRCGIEYGPFHRKIIELRASSEEVLARLRPPAENPADWTRGYYLHPGILDSALQASAGLLMATMADGDQDLPLMVPVGIESICVYKFVQGGEYYAHVTTAADTAADSDMLRCNIRLYDADGIPCVHIAGFQMRRMPIAVGKQQKQRSQPHAVGAADHHAGSAEFFHGVWKETPLVAGEPGVSGRWLVFGSGKEVERQLAPVIAGSGIELLLVPFAHYRDADIDGLQAIFGKSGPVDGIVYLGDYDLEATLDAAADTDTLRRLFTLFRAITAHSRKQREFQRIRFVRATRHAWRLVGGGEEQPDIRKSLATGFLRTARIEFPLLDVRQVDLGDTDAASAARCLYQELVSVNADARAGPESLYHADRRYTLAVEPVTINRRHEREAVFNRDKVFWIIGGTSGIGQVLAKYLATNYRCSLVLSGSRRLPEPAQYDRYLAEHDDAITATIRFLREIESLGSTVSYASMDVRSADSVRLALAAIHKSHAHLNGIYFGALQLDDKMILQKDWPGYRNMLDMRVNGLNELLRQLGPDKPEFMVLFSSLAGITGNIGQSDYAASCAYMDGIPLVQAADNDCRLISVQWGAWALGQQVSDIVLEHMRRNGFLHISELLGMEALEKIILGDRNSIAFVPGSEDASHIATNINSLRQGLGSKPGRSKVVKTRTAEEDKPMSNPQPETSTVMHSGQVEVLMREFGKQRDMLMQLCENQNALLATVLGGAVLELPSVPAPAPVPVATAVPAATVAPALEPEAVAPAAEPPPAEAAPAAPERPGDLFSYVRSLMAGAVEMQPEDIDPDQNFMELGADSMTAMSMVKDMEECYRIELPATLLFEYATLNELVEFLKTEVGEDDARRA
jgi:acyl transferase domain-containing protein/acyl-CoA synthetase (AMP-forming)/AMP-acid ligase II/acyl carrier protein/NADP-dependent 3-hydroxy acid dehydrogenase YdfG